MLTKKVHGPSHGHSATIVSYLVGASAQYLSLAANQAAALGLALPRAVLLGLPLLIAAPLSLLRDISGFAYTSALGVLVNSVVIVVLCYEAAATLQRDGVALLQGAGATDGTSSLLAPFMLSSTVAFSFQVR